jgi:hypothetical protein
MLYPYVAPTFSGSVVCSPSGTVEKGTVVTVTGYKINITKGSANIHSAVWGYDQDETYPDAGLTAEDIATVNTKGSLSKSYSPSSTKTFTSAADMSYKMELWDTEKNYSAALSGKPTWVYPYYHGVLPATTSDGIAADLKTLTKLVASKGTKTVKFNATNQKMVFAAPASNGVIKKIVDPNGFDITSTFTQYSVSMEANDGTTQNWYMYLANSASTVTDFSVTFSH